MTRSPAGAGQTWIRLSSKACGAHATRSQRSRNADCSRRCIAKAEPPSLRLSRELCSEAWLRACSNLQGLGSLDLLGELLGEHRLEIGAGRVERNGQRGRVDTLVAECDDGSR